MSTEELGVSVIHLHISIHKPGAEAVPFYDVDYVSYSSTNALGLFQGEGRYVSGLLTLIFSYRFVRNFCQRDNLFLSGRESPWSEMRHDFG